MQKYPRDRGCSIYVTVCYDFVKLTLSGAYTGCWMVSHDLTKVHKGNLNRKVYYSQVLEKVPGMPEGAAGGDQGRVQ